MVTTLCLSPPCLLSWMCSGILRCPQMLPVGPTDYICTVDFRFLVPSWYNEKPNWSIKFTVLGEASVYVHSSHLIGQFGFLFFCDGTNNLKLAVLKTAWWIHCTNTGRCQYYPICVRRWTYVRWQRQKMYIRTYVCTYVQCCTASTVGHILHTTLSYHITPLKTPLHMYVRVCVLLWGTKFTNWLLFMYLFPNQLLLHIC